MLRLHEKTLYNQNGEEVSLGVGGVKETPTLQTSILYHTIRFWQQPAFSCDFVVVLHDHLDFRIYE